MSAQRVIFATLGTNITGTTASTSQEVAGFNGAQVLEIIAVGTVAAQAATFQIQGSFDNTNWYSCGSYQVDANDTLTRSTAAVTLTPGNGTVRHVYQIVDPYMWLRVNVTANTLGTGLSVKCYAAPM